MTPSLASETISTIVHLAAFSRDGVTLDDVVNAFPNRPDPQEAQRWLDELVVAKILEADPATTPPRYAALDAAVAYLSKDLQATLAAGAGTSPKTSADASPAPVADDPDFVALFEQLVTPIVAGVMPRASAMAFAQNGAAQGIPDVAKRSSFVTYALERLSRLTLGECIRLGLQPEQFEVWRRTYFGATASPGRRPVASSKTALDPSPIQEDVTAPETPKQRRTSHTPAPQTADQAIEEVIKIAVETASATGTNASPRTGAYSVPASATQGLAKLLAAQLTTLVPGRASPVVTALLTTAVGALVVALASLVRGSPGFLVAVALLVVGGALGWSYLGRRRGMLVGAAAGVNDEATSGVGNVAGREPDTSPASTGQGAGRGLVRRTCVVAAGIGFVALVVAGWWVWDRRTHPPKEIVSAYIQNQFAPLPVKVVGVELTYGHASSLGCPLTIQAGVATTAPLYRSVVADDYLRTHAPAEMAAIAAANVLLADAHGARLGEAIGDAFAPNPHPKSAPATAPKGVPDAPSPRLDAIALVTTQTSPGTAVLVTGTLLSWRNGGTWGFTGDLHWDRSSFRGQPATPNTTTFAVDVPADVDRLNALIAAHAAYAAKVQAVAATLAQERERVRRQRLDAYAQRLRPGALLNGVVVDPSRGESHRVAFELLTVSATTQTLTASLHNDGGWSEARAFQGDWAVPADDALCTLTLRSRDADRVDGAGPWLETRGATTVVLQVHPDGAVTDAHGQWQLRLIEPANAAEVKAEFTRAVAQAMDATKAGLVYRGVAVSKLRQTTERVQLRFLEQDPAGLVLRALMEAQPEFRGASTASAAAPWVRPFRGTLLGNSYRAGGRPIRLRSDDADRVARAGQGSPLGVNTTNNSLTIALAVDGTRLTGEDAFFRYELEPAAATALADDRAGTRDQGPGTRDSARSAATRDQGPETSDLSEPGRSAPRDLPASTPNAELGTPHSASAAVSALDPRSQTLDPAATAALARSAAPGAYALVDGRWVPLPKTKSHLVQTLVQKLNASLTKLAQVEDAAVGKSAEASKTLVGMLTFDGKEAPPVVPAKDLVVVYVGALPTLPAKDLAKYPVLQTYPPIELAPATLQPSGVRQAPMFLLAPGYFAFGPARVSATVEHPEENVTLLRCSTRLARGPYALVCGSETYEVRAD